VTWFGWLWLSLIILGTFVNCARIGEPRGPLDAGDVIAGIFLSGLLFWGSASIGILR
jgi:hypothetical protein